MVEEWFRAAVQDSCGASIWPLQVGELIKPPFGVYERQEAFYERHLDGPAGIPVVTFGLMLVAESYAEIRRLATLVRMKLPDFKGYQPDFRLLDAWIDGEVDGEPIEYPGDERPLFTVNQVWNVRYSEE